METGDIWKVCSDFNEISCNSTRRNSRNGCSYYHFELKNPSLFPRLESLNDEFNMGWEQGERNP